MKKIVIAFALLLSSICAGAFDFDGISLNEPYSKVANEIAKRGYSYDHETNCLFGNCQGVNLYLGFNYLDVSKPGMLGQLIVLVPIQGDSETSYSNAASIFNVIYHQVDNEDDGISYMVDTDGTSLKLGRREGYLTLTYNTPYYQPKKS